MLHLNRCLYQTAGSQLGYVMAPMGDEETYNILVFFGVMSNLRDCDGAGDIFFILGFAWLVSRILKDGGSEAYQSTQ
jgi:hypothetical protein